MRSFQLINEGNGGQRTARKGTLVLLVLLAANGRAQTPNVIAWGNDDHGELNVPSSLTDAKAISGCEYHSLAVKSDGTVVAWGYNYNNLGETNVPSGLSGVVAVSCGNLHNLALKKDGTVVAWGYNGDGQTNVPAGLAGVVAIAAGAHHSMALKNDGTVVAWGWNNFGQTKVPSGLTGAVAISAGGLDSMALKSDGTVVAWGWNLYGQANVPASLTHVVAIASGGYHNMALKSDGTVVAWGYDNRGQTDVPAGLTGVSAIAAGYGHSEALKSDGTVVAWGDNNKRQSDVPAGLKGVWAIAAGSHHNLALTLSPIALVTIASSAAGRAFSVSGIGCHAGNYTAPMTFAWVPNSSCTVSFVSPQSGGTGTQYLFNSWHDSNIPGSTRTLTVPATATTYTADFTTQYFLVTSASPSGGGTVTGAGWYNDGVAATVAASPNNGYSFYSWTGAVSTGPATGKVLMNGPRNAIAKFTTLTPVMVTTSPAGRPFSVDGFTYTAAHVFFWPAGTKHNIAVASPQTGNGGASYVFANWSDGGALSHTITTGATGTTYTATFKTQYLLTTLASPTAGGKLLPATGYVDAGAKVQVSATANTGFVFTGFSGSLTGTTTPAQLIVNGPVTVTGHFGAPPDLTIALAPSGSFVKGGTGDSFTITVRNSGLGTATGAVTVTNLLPSGLIGSTMAGAGWTCNISTLKCTLVDPSISVAPGLTYPPIVLTVLIAANAPASVTDTVSVSGGGELNTANDTASYSVTIRQTALVTVTTSPVGSGQTVIVDGVTYVAPHLFTWVVGDVHVIGISSPQTPPIFPLATYVFNHWSDFGPISHSISVSSGALTYTAFCDKF